jgi:hypothetical protein
MRFIILVSALLQMGAAASYAREPDPSPEQFISAVTDVEAPPYFATSGALPTARQSAASFEIVQHREFNAKAWPAIKITSDRKSLLPFMKSREFLNVEMPVFDHSTNRFKPFKFQFYAPDKSAVGQSRLVVIYPTIEGVSIVERNIARIALNSGHHVLIAPVFDFPYLAGAEGLPDLADRTILGVKAVKTFFDFIQYAFRNDAHPDVALLRPFSRVRPDQILQIGVSNGTVATYMVSQTDSRVSDQILIVPVANVPGVMATTQNVKLTAFREEQMKYYGIKTTFEYAVRVRQHLKVDPLDFVAPSLGGARTVVFTQVDDQTVRSRFQSELTNRIRAVTVSRAVQGAEQMRRVTQSMRQFIEVKSPATIQVSDKEFEETHAAWAENRILHAVEEQQMRDSLFHEVGLGHLGKILAITFLFSGKIKAVMNSPLPSFDYNLFETNHFFERAMTLRREPNSARVCEALFNAVAN